MDAMSPVWPPASYPCATRKSTPAPICRWACSRLPTRAATRAPASWALVNQSRRRRPDGADVQLDGVGRTDLPEVGGPLHHRVAPAESGRRRDPLPAAAGRRSGPGGRRQNGGARRARLPCRVAIGALELEGDQRVDPVATPSDMIVDPFQLHIELVGAERRGPEHTEAAGIHHGGDDVPAVTEGDDRKFTAQHVAQLRTHRIPLDGLPSVHSARGPEPGSLPVWLIGDRARGWLPVGGCNMTLTAADLRVGDSVEAQGDHPGYEVASVDAQQGRVQVADTNGEVHTYHRTDTVEVARPDLDPIRRPRRDGSVGSASEVVPGRRGCCGTPSSCRHRCR